jgi:hypothetical protein
MQRTRCGALMASVGRHRVPMDETHRVEAIGIRVTPRCPQSTADLLRPDSQAIARTASTARSTSSGVLKMAGVKRG